MHRLPEITPETMSPEQREVHRAIVSGPRGVVPGPLLAWLHSPTLATRAESLGAFCRYETSLPPRLSELAILVTGAFWRAGYEWHVHAPIGLAAGLDPQAVDTLRLGGTPRFARDDETAVHGFAHEMLNTHTVSDATYRHAVQALGMQGVVELVGILGYYGLIAMTINAFRIPVPDGAVAPFEPEHA